MSRKAIVKAFECGHREFTGCSYRQEHPGFDGIALACVGLCMQCKSQLCDHPMRSQQLIEKERRELQEKMYDAMLSEMAKGSFR